jgi:hypothetical protein
MTKLTFLRFEITEIKDENMNLFLIPSDLGQFEFDYRHSKFIECNCTLARERITPTYKQNLEKSSQALDVLNFATDYLESIQKQYVLFSGTLLGWFRDCGVIPFTTDLDLFVSLDQYESKIKKFFKFNKGIGSLAMVHGMRSDTYELRIRNKMFWLDLFFGSKKNETHMMVGYFIGRSKHW